MVETFNFEIPKKEIVISKAQSVGKNIVNFGADNLYPTHMESLIDSSETASLCVKTETKFLATGFVNESLDDKIVGKNWMNNDYYLSDLLYDIAYSISKFRGAYLSVTRDLTGVVKDIHLVDFPMVRFTEFDDSMHSNAVIIGDWSKTIKKVNNKKNFSILPLYKSDYQVFKRLSEIYKTTTSIYPIFENTVYYYPLNQYESVANDMGSEYELQVNRYEEITQGSPAKIVIATDLSTDERKREKQLEQIKSFAGSKGNRVLVIKTSFGEDGEPITNGYKLDKIEDTRDLSKFIEAEGQIEKNIRKVAQIPSILVSPNDGATIDSSAAQMKMAIRYYNDICSPTRELISKSLTKILGEDCTLKEFSDDSYSDF